ncbi:MAG: YtxH domain-containing protein [Elusimicrobia bacterium]|nr:YtxH domain-containing protein [Elusimicrobiota bacterium]
MADNRGLKTLWWFIGGAAVGAAIGLLYAPKKGEETREDVAGWLRQKREQTRDLANRLKEKFPAKKEQGAAGKESYAEGGNHRHRETVAA